jgi:hypothetical protein
MNTIKFSDLPKLGEPLAGGVFRGIYTKPDGTHCAVVRLPGLGEGLTHGKADAWAKEQGGKLPSKVVGALLASNEDLPAGLYWTCEEVNASYAWGFSSNGLTGYYHKSYEGWALAVRLLTVTA